MAAPADLERDHIPLVADAIEHPPAAGDVKPTWRGWIHLATFPLAIVLGIVLMLVAANTAARAAAAVFMLSSLLLFGISATYHRINWSPKVKALFRRLDHSNIFLLIAGTYTPIAVCCLPTTKAVVLLSIVWGGALLGIGFRIFWLGAPRWLYVPLYLALGWAAMLYIVDLVNANVATMVLILVGGAAYTTGAIFYGTKRPNPVPGVFGFHEMFHSCTVIAFLCQWVGILLITINPPAL
ncbi:PAQR family membrane homeostasis protein TrhA [Schumannella soli]|uniref:Hemolysin III family protein n=1 Tax=Schumannella soli TaxID=2590779 RepID=A0A506Y437_9MICO|nr:hemolysin III family protein [Schumannella soli]TPW75778.1 hemolysin III family protein [Schumannella soli]